MRPRRGARGIPHWTFRSGPFRDGVRAQEVIESLSEDIQEELGHAQEFARRIKELWGIVPGSMEFEAHTKRVICGSSRGLCGSSP